jgi:hypothetical protein
MTELSKDAWIIKIMSAIRVFHKYGMDEALRVYPDLKPILNSISERADQYKKKEAISFLEWLIKDGWEQVETRPSTEQLYNLFKEQKAQVTTKAK